MSRNHMVMVGRGETPACSFERQVAGQRRAAAEFSLKIQTKPTFGQTEH